MIGFYLLGGRVSQRRSSTSSSCALFFKYLRSIFFLNFLLIAIRTFAHIRLSTSPHHLAALSLSITRSSIPITLISKPPATSIVVTLSSASFPSSKEAPSQSTYRSNSLLNHVLPFLVNFHSFRIAFVTSRGDLISMSPVV